ncbi:MAG TPA: M48 family metalloprotease [Thermoplasmata archaeon]|nr:M48 family metalloprotease [Thermoplasmata archaeon]
MAVAALLLSYTPVLAWVAVGLILLVMFRQGASPTVFRLAAIFLGTWALLATTVLVWVLSRGGTAGVLRIVRAPLSLFQAVPPTVWVWGAVGAFLVFLVAFLLSQTVGRGFIALLRPTPVPFPPRLPIPTTPTSLLRFPSRQSEAFTFTLLEVGGPRRIRRRDVILVADGLLEQLEPEEWEAVVAHELGHLRELDGRYLTFIRTLSRMMRWDPVLAYLADSLTRREEYRADLDAVQLTARPRALARALYKASLQPPRRAGSLASLLGVGGRRGRRETVERIRRLVALAESGRFPEDSLA